MSVSVVLLAFLLAGAPAQQNGTSTPADASSKKKASQGTAPLNPNTLPVSIDKIQKALAQEPTLGVADPATRSDTGVPVFRVHVERQSLSIEEILGPDYLRGPVPYGGMTHQEFLNMVTPKDVQGYAAFSNGQAITVAATSFALKWALQTALREFQEARGERAREAARKEVREALEALRKARLEAGLPDK